MALENSILDRYRVQIDLFDGFLSGHLKYFNNLDFLRRTLRISTQWRLCSQNAVNILRI